MKKIIPILGLSLLTAASSAYAGTASETYFELGVGYADFRQNNDSVAEMNVWRGVFNYSFSGDAPVLIADVRSTWEYAEGYSDKQRYMIGNVEAVVGASLFSLIKAYAFAGPEIQTYNDFKYLPEKYTNWDLGYTYGAAVEVELIPSILHVTPYVRASHADEMERVRYGLDVSVWVTWFGVGADLNYQDYRGDADAECWQACIYAGLRF